MTTALIPAKLQAKLEFFDVLVPFFVAVFLRQYLWLTGNTVAWILTIVGAILLTVVYLVVKERPNEKRPPAFWVIVALPLFAMYALRAVHADLSFDVLNYHIFHSERGLRGLLLIPGDFAPAYFPFLNNTAPDILTGMFRHLLGFRMGTLVNYLMLLWTGAIVFKFLRPYALSGVLRSIAVLLVLFSEQFFFEISNYMVDLLPLPLLMEATYLLLRDHESVKKPQTDLVLISLLLGAAVALKLTNLVFAAPLELIALYRFAVQKRISPAEYLKTMASVSVAFALPIIPYATYVYRFTGNPIFPWYNKFFKSPFWPLENSLDERFGPKGLLETMAWPVKMVLEPARLGELNVYSGRVGFGCVAAVLVLALVRRDYRLRILSIVLLIGSILWSKGTGNIRYGLYLEIISGIVLVAAGLALWQRSDLPQRLRQAVAIVLWCVLLGQVSFAFSYSLRHEWGERPTIFGSWRAYRTDVPNVFVDRSLTKYLSADEAAMFASVGGWIESSYKTSSLMVMLKANAPCLSIYDPGYAATPAALRRYRAALHELQGKRLVSLAFAEDLGRATTTLNKKGFKVVKVTTFNLPYYSATRRLPLVVMDVEPDPTARIENFFNAQLSIGDAPTSMKAGQTTTLRVRIKNTSRSTWPARAEGSNHEVMLGNKWLDSAGGILINDDGRTAMPEDIVPGRELELTLEVRAPETPGTYTLLLDLVQEHVSWFYEKGSTTAEVTVNVEP